MSVDVGADTAVEAGTIGQDPSDKAVDPKKMFDVVRHLGVGIVGQDTDIIQRRSFTAQT